MVLSESMNERERPGDFVGLSIATLRMILCCDALPEYSGRTIVKKSSGSELGISFRIFRKIRDHILTAVWSRAVATFQKDLIPDYPINASRGAQNDAQIGSRANLCDTAIGRPRKLAFVTGQEVSGK
jgi:hypothetical protein